MNPEKSLRPQSRPDRKGLWVRFRHPISNASLRVDLGTDRQEAETVCDDLNMILGAPQRWEDRNHPDLDGLHEKALNAYFGEFEKICGLIKEKIAETQLETLKLRISLVDKMVKLIWMTSEVGMQARRKGDFDFAFLLEGLDGDEETVPSSRGKTHTRKKAPSPTKRARQ